MDDNVAKTQLFYTLMGGQDRANRKLQGYNTSPLDFFKKRGKSIENALGTTLVAVPTSIVKDRLENASTDQMRKDNKTRMNEVAKKYGYNTYHDVWDARDEAEKNGDQETLNKIDNIINPELQAQANENAAKATKKAKDYADYRENSYVGQKINQDNAKFAGSAINTLSTGFDVASTLAGIPNTPMVNAIQGGIEGFADELEENGGTIDTPLFGGSFSAKNWDKFSGERALSNMAAGAAGGLATGGLNKAIGGRSLIPAKGKISGLAGKIVNSGVGRGALSGAVGGGVGAGTSAALNGQDIIGSAVEGAKQGAIGGAVAGGVIGGANRLTNAALNRFSPETAQRMQNNAQAWEKWKNSGSNFDERLTNTITSGESGVGNWIQGKQSKTLGRIGDSIGNRIKPISDYTSEGLGPRKAEAESYKDLIKEYYDEERGGLQGAIEDARAAGLPNDTNFRKAQRLVEGGSLGITPEDAFKELKDVYGDNFKESTYINKDGSWKYKNGEPYVWTTYKNKIGMMLDKEMRARDAQTVSQQRTNTNVPQRLNELRQAIDNENISYGELAELQNYYPEIMKLGDARLAEAAGIPEEVFNGSRALKNTPTGRQQLENLKYEPLSDQEMRIREDSADWANGQYRNPEEFYRLHGDINDFDNIRFKNKYTGEIASGAELREEGLLSDLYSNSDFRNFGAGRKNSLGGANSQDEFNLYIEGDSADNLSNVVKDYTDWEPTEDWNVNRQLRNADLISNNTPTTAKDWLKQAGKRALEDLNDKGVGLSLKKVDNQQFPEDIRNMQINNNMAEIPEAEIAPTRSAVENTPETQVYRALQPQAEVESTYKPMEMNPDELMYGESQLGNRTRRGMLADTLERFGNTLEGAQTNVTRAAEKDLGIESAGKVVENVRKKTGLTNLETQAKLANEITGGENSLMDSVQRQALSASEDGKGYKVDTTPVLNEVESIVDKYADTNMFGSLNARSKFISNLKGDIANLESDVLTIANRMKANAADLRGKGVVDPKPVDAAKARIYTEIANKLDDISYKSIPQENIDAMFDATISEMRGRANQATRNGNNDIANAYNRMADNLDKQPRTAKAYRSFKKDFVDVSKVAKLTARAENGAASQMGRSFGGGLKRFASTFAQRPTNAALAKVGGAVNSFADRIEGNRTSGDNIGRNITPETPTPTNPTGRVPSQAIWNEIGRTEATDQGEKARTARYLANAVNNQDAQSLEDLASPASAYSTSVYDTMYGAQVPATGQEGMQMQAEQQSNSMFPATGDYWTDVIGVALTGAINDRDVEAFTTLYGMYQDALAEQQKSASGSQEKLTDTQRRAYAADNAWRELSTIEPDAAYNLSKIPVIGDIATFGGNQYKSATNSLATQIGYMLSGANITPAEAERIGNSYVPQPFDNETTRAQKLQRAKEIIERYKSGYADNSSDYGYAA